MKYRNKSSEDAVILCGYVNHAPTVIQPNEIVELDPERLKKMFDPADIERQLEPIGMGAKAAPAAVVKESTKKEESEDEKDRAALVKLLKE